MNGKGTYIGAILCGIIGLVWSFGWIPLEVAVGMGAVVETFTKVRLRMGVKKAEKAANGG